MVVEVDFAFFSPGETNLQSISYTIFKQLGPLILRQLRTVDFAGRVAGDSFAAMLPETPLSGAFIAGDRLRQAVEAYQFIGETVTDRKKVALNVGMATFPEHGLTAEELTDSAHKALQQARREGGNKTVVFPDVLYKPSEVFRNFGPAATPNGEPAAAGEKPTDATAKE
jgi:hypothetical protein